jgi:hypothetical protein
MYGYKTYLTFVWDIMVVSVAMGLFWQEFQSEKTRVKIFTGK